MLNTYRWLGVWTEYCRVSNCADHNFSSGHRQRRHNGAGAGARDYAAGRDRNHLLTIYSSCDRGQRIRVVGCRNNGVDSDQ